MMRAVVHAVVWGALHPSLVFFSKGKTNCGPIPDEVLSRGKAGMDYATHKFFAESLMCVVAVEIASSLYSIHPLGTVHVSDAAHTQVFFLLLFYKTR